MVAAGEPAAAAALQERFGWVSPAATKTATGGRAPHAPDGAALMPSALRRTLEDFARAAAPLECCGIGIGPPGTVAEFHPLPNVHEQPHTRYEIAADDQLRAYRRALERDWEITLVFHSHPQSEAFPSATDRRLAAWPDAVYAIMSLAEEPPTLRGFHIADGSVQELAGFGDNPP